MVWFQIWIAVTLTMVVGERAVRGGEVTYDGRSLIIDAQKKLLFSGSIHYPRSTPDMWPLLISKAKDGGVDVIQTYVFWNLHEPQPGQYDFSGRYDLVKFIKEIQAQGLYACLRIGPYIESEWNYGGLPFWLHDVPGIVYRSDNEPFKFYMQNFTTKIVNLMKSKRLFASQGGPIILSQIENEYQNVEAAFHEKGTSYVKWAAQMAVALQTGVPWIMCKQADAPDPVINTCNGMRCGETFAGPNSPNKPSIWTENWTSFYQVYGGDPYIRSAEDIAYHVALFVAKGGSYVNYYMYYGGTNFGRTSSAYVITRYYDQAPLDEYGFIRQPKWGHLKALHNAIKLCSTTLLHGVRTNLSLGPLQEAIVWQEMTGGCTAFLINKNATISATIQFHDNTYTLLPKSIIILSDCQNVLFNTRKVTAKYNKRMARSSQVLGAAQEWEEFKDVIPNFNDTSLLANMLLEHMNTTKDQSDHLWYTSRLEVNTSCLKPLLHVESNGHVVQVFLNNIYMGIAHGSHDKKGFSFESSVTLDSHIIDISIINALVGLPDSGAYLERKFAGLTKVRVHCSDNEYDEDFSNQTWGYQVGLLGEKLQIYKEENLEVVKWSKMESSTSEPLTWYKTLFDAPQGNDPVALNMTTMGKGEVWINGQSIGRYWITFLTPEGNPSQTMYHVPRSFLKDSGNLMIVLEELGGDPLQITLHTISVTNLSEYNANSEEVLLHSSL